jgi:hypothetical protein
MCEVNEFEMLNINGGELEKPSDYFFLVAAVSACFISPWIGVPLAIAIIVS